MAQSGAGMYSEENWVTKSDSRVNCHLHAESAVQKKLCDDWCIQGQVGGDRRPTVSAHSMT